MFDLTNKVIVITGGTGLLGPKHAEAVAEFGAIPVLWDLDAKKAEEMAARIAKEYGVDAVGAAVDITQEDQIEQAKEGLLQRFGKIDGLINNAANNPKVSAEGQVQGSTRLEQLGLEQWNQDMAVGITGAFLCVKHLGPTISQNPEGGSIINIASDLGLIAPDQRLYRKEGVPEEEQPVKPVTYSVVKTGLIGLTRYVATYWAEKRVRCNAICPGGVYAGQDENFVQKVTKLIPLGRMARQDEYKGLIVFLASEASSYMNGAVLSIDGGRSVW